MGRPPIPQVEADEREILPPRVHRRDCRSGDAPPDPGVGDAGGGAEEPDVGAIDDGGPLESAPDLPRIK